MHSEMRSMYREMVRRSGRRRDAIRMQRTRQNNKPSQKEGTEEVMNVLGPEWSIEASGPLKYLACKGHLQTEGHHEYFVSQNGSDIIGKLGDTERPVLSLF